MARFQLILLDEAKDFLSRLPAQVYKKILYNIHRVAGGEMNTELFKKLGNSDIWEFRTLYEKTAEAGRLRGVEGRLLRRNRGADQEIYG